MKSPFFDDTLNWDDMVSKTILSPEFTEAWEKLKGTGIGSREVSARVAQLIRDSEWHLKRLEQQHAEILDAVASSEISGYAVDQEIAGQLLITATSYMIMGIMLGVAFTVRRLAEDLSQEEETPATAPLVN